MTDYRYGRKLHGIQKDVHEKISDWISTIQDEKVKELAKANTIVTGGAIASMLLGEKVNDYDVYFRDFETTVAVAEYYANFIREKYKGGKQTLSVLYGDNTYELVASEDDDSLAGYIRWTFEQNPDRVFFNVNDNGFTSFEKKSFKKKYRKYRPVVISNNAISLSDKVQLVTRFYGNPKEIHNNYDFVHATCYYDYGKKELVTKKKALLSLMSRTLEYHGSLYPVASIFRMKKFLERGWRISAGEQFKIMYQISKLDLNNMHVLRDQMVGVDAAYLWKLLQLLKESETIDNNTIFNAVENVFNNTEFN